MQYFDDVPFSKECLVELSQDDFPLTHKCAKHFQNDDPVVIRILHDQEINHPLAIMMFEEKTSENIHIYSLEVHPKCRYNFYGRRMIDKLKENRCRKARYFMKSVVSTKKKMDTWSGENKF